MRPLIIGGYGQIGSQLPEEWERIPRRKKDIYDISLAIEMRNPDIVINCAGIKGEQCSLYPHEALCSNIAVPIEVARVCNKMNINMVHLSTFYVGEGTYYDTKSFLDMAFRNVRNVSTIYLPCVFDENHIPRLFDERFHVLYLKDLVDWIVQNIHMMAEVPIDVWLCNDGYPSRKEFLDFIGEVKEPEQRKVFADEDYEEHDLIKLRHWKDAVKECYGL